MNIEKFSNLSFFKVGKYEYKNRHICDFSSIPRPHFCMGLLLKGSAVFTSGENSISLSVGDIIFVPITSQYISTWQGSPDILYISMHFAFEPQCGISERNRFALQKLSLPDFDDLRQKFTFALNNYNKDLSSQAATLGVFFELLSRILPRLKKDSTTSSDKQMEQIIEYLNMNSEQKISISHLAEMCNMSVPNLYVRFSKYTSMSPIEYKNAISVRRAMRLLKGNSSLSIEKISEMLGFDSSSYFRRVFKKFTGVSPREYRNSKIEM